MEEDHGPPWNSEEGGVAEVLSEGKHSVVAGTGCVKETGFFRLKYPLSKWEKKRLSKIYWVSDEMINTIISVFLLTIFCTSGRVSFAII